MDLFQVLKLLMVVRSPIMFMSNYLYSINFHFLIYKIYPLFNNALTISIKLKS